LTVAEYRLARPFFKILKKMRHEIQDNSSCSETCCPSSKQSDNDIKNLLRVCYTEWVVMGILATMIMLKMETYLDDEEWMWYTIYSTMLFVFSLPFVVGFHSHAVPRCNCNDKESSPSPKPNSASEESESSASSAIVEKAKRKSKSKKRSSKTKSKKKSGSKKRNVKSSIKNKQKPASASALTKSSSESESWSSSSKGSPKEQGIGVTKKVQDFLGFGVTRETNDEFSSEESSISTSSSIEKKMERKTSSKKQQSVLTGSSSGLESSSSSTEVSKEKRSSKEKLKSVLLKKEEPKDTTIVIENDIFKGSDAENEERTVEAKLVIKKEPALPGEEVKLEYDLIVNVDPDEEDNMIVNVQGQVEGGEMDVSTHAATEGEGQANVEAEIQHGAKKDKGEVEIVVSSEAGSSSDEMNLKARKKKKTVTIKE